MKSWWIDDPVSRDRRREYWCVFAFGVLICIVLAVGEMRDVTPHIEVECQDERAKSGTYRVWDATGIAMWDDEYLGVHRVWDATGTTERDGGYLSASFECDCGYSPAIAHPSYKDCVEYYQRKYEECRDK